MANSADPDQTSCSAASDLGLHWLLRPVYPNTQSKYGKVSKSEKNKLVKEVGRV